MAKLNEGRGYGQIELNQCAFRRDGRIEAQCKIAEGIEFVENGTILAVDNVTRTVGYPTADSKLFALNYTSEHMYDERLVGGLKHYKTDKDSFLPRLGYLSIGDKFTTNAIIYDGDIKNAKVGYVVEGEEGYIHVGAEDAGLEAAPKFIVIDANATMPNGAPAVKLQCVKA